MFQVREPQESLWQSEFLITPRKAKLMRRSWAEVFRNEALVLIEEERFRSDVQPGHGQAQSRRADGAGSAGAQGDVRSDGHGGVGGVGVQSAVATTRCGWR